MAVEPNYCFTNTYENALASSLQVTTSDNIVFNLSVLKEKAQHVHSAAAVFVTQSQTQPAVSVSVPVSNSTCVNMENIVSLLQEIIAIASNVMFTCQNVVPGVPAGHHDNTLEFDQLTQSNMMFEWSDGGGGGGGDSSFGVVTGNARNKDNGLEKKHFRVETDSYKGSESGSGKRLSPNNYDIIEMDAADLLAKYTHYCQVCGKGFKRDANLRMHMRAHGDEYKSVAALANPVSLNGHASTKLAKKYSCPQEGCRWNRKHAKFQPLKSMICMKNHYKRSHCPKMYSCKRCQQKQFSVLSDLRTHEKHCGDVKWRCSCGTTFSRKDKLMGHVGLFIGHTPIIDQ
ncbi:hypothetical protein SSX86_000767 [Deinandra increscens subsp. villosa]|uniref:C2H2-type domain-containing protein n=1 Tax=Deinandra increscens subsp. villosa TaxID=3103831 RepID=A0AAP0DUU2_9ASTR